MLANWNGAQSIHAELQPGMQSTVMVKTGERTLMDYLLRPILRRFVTAMRE